MLAEALDRMPSRSTWLICGMLKTKDVAGYLAPLSDRIDGLIAVSIPGEDASLDATGIVSTAQSLGIDAQSASSPRQALEQMPHEQQHRVVIGGSLYLAGRILKDHG
jgi:dihydrofolate synthase/folylpolyglutamate synthase